MLLSVETLNTVDGAILDVWEVGGKHHYFKPPFQPYFYSLVPTPNGTPVKRKLLSTLEETKVWQVDFKTTDDLEAERSEHTIEDDVPFNQRIAMDIGFKFPSNEPKLASWDAESITFSQSPNPYEDVVKSLGAWPSKFFSKIKRDNKDERQVIDEFLKHVQKDDPDVLADYYGRFYDVPLLMTRCKANHIKCELGRDGSKPYIIKRKFERRGKGKRENTVRIHGRVHFDVHKEVEQDYTLTLAGLKSRGLNEVSQHFGLNPITGVDHANIPEDRLEEVNLDDCRCTFELAKIYLRNLYALAELLDVPLNMIVNRSPSHIANYIYGRAFKEKGIVSDGPNYKRWPQVFQKGKRSCQGAFIKCFRTGTFFNVTHSDWRSLYPSNMIAFNLDPETLTLVELKPYTGVYKFEDHGDYAIIEVPDTVEGQFARQVVVRVDLSFDSITRIKLLEILEKRSELKAEYKKTKDEKLKSQQWALKVIANALFGYHIMRYARYGNPLVGILTAAIGRYIIKHSIKGKKIIECDTDGYYEINFKGNAIDLTKLFPPCFKLDVFQLNSTKYDGMLSVDDKSYILYKDGKITKHGSGLLGRHQPPICDLFVDDLCKALFKKQDPHSVMRKYGDLTGHAESLFVMRATISKKPSSYKKTTMYYNLVMQFRQHNVPLRWGDRVHYIKTTRGYCPTMFLKEDTQIDYSYYKGRLASVASRILKIRARELLPFFAGQVTLM